MQFSYLGPRMKGIASTFQQWAITPLSSNQYWQPNDVIKIMGNISQGLVDFYRSHIQFQVQVFIETQPIGLIQIDSSAQSVINQTVILSNQVEVERIQQYDTLSAYLTDIGFSQFVCQSRQGQGLGYSNIPTSLPMCLARSQPNMSSSLPPYNTTGSQTFINRNNIGGYSPIISPQFPASTAYGLYDGTTGSTFTNALSSGISTSWQSPQNWITYTDPTIATPTADTYTSLAGRAMAVRAQYNQGAPYYPDAPYSVPVSSPWVKNQSWSYTTMSSSGFNPTKPYQITYTPKLFSGAATNTYNAASCGVSGYTKPVLGQFCRGSGQPFLSATVPQLQMLNGKILPAPIPLARKTFRMPLISAICGVLIPPDQFQLIPAEALKNIILQITLNPYAFFTGGYSDIHQLDSIGMQPQNMQKRKWQFNSFQWVWHLYNFNNQQINAALKDKLYKTIQISSNFCQLSAQYQLANGSYVRNSFQMPINVESLAQVVVLFLSNQYTTKSFCRKQFRLSNNITSMQIKANGSFYPIQPILGNAGNPQVFGQAGDNWNYYEQLLLSNNFLFNTNVPLPKINQKNFAINGRIYNTQNLGTFLPLKYYKTTPADFATMYNSLNGIALPTNMINADTAMGQSWFHQNRYIGKAAFCYTFQPYGHSKTLINGLDTRGYRQFDIVFNTSPQDIFPHDETMFIFSRSNVVVKYTPQGIQVLGA